jgi:hypothetical protein
MLSSHQILAHIVLKQKMEEVYNNDMICGKLLTQMIMMKSTQKQKATNL